MLNEEGRNLTSRWTLSDVGKQHEAISCLLSCRIRGKHTYPTRLSVEGAVTGQAPRKSILQYAS